METQDLNLLFGQEFVAPRSAYHDRRMLLRIMSAKAGVIEYDDRGEKGSALREMIVYPLSEIVAT
jgi:hypothetical protein